MHDYAHCWHKAEQKARRDGLQVIEHGWEQHVIVDEANGVVFRYPRHQSAADKLADEVSVLSELNKMTWPVQIPKIIDHQPGFTSYHYIPGRVLSHRTLSHLHREDKAIVGRSLGEFLASLHGVDTEVAQQKQTKQTMSLLDYYHDRIEGAPTSNYYEQAKLHLGELIATSKASKKSSVIVHGDLHGLNVVIDADEPKLSGVIDFSELEIGDPHLDFRKVFMTHSDLLQPALDGYQTKKGVQLDPTCVKLWAYVNEWANVCYFDHDKHNGTYIRAMAHLERWQLV